MNSPGAPGVPELLAQPGRRAPGSVELRVLHSTATLDAAFAVAAGWIGDCFWAKTEAQRAVPDPGSGLEPELLEAEITRRLRGIAPGHIAPHRDHLVRTALGETALRDEEAGPRREILLRINGRRTCRDLAFLLGRGLYPITVEVSWWNAKGVVGVTDRDPYVDTATLPRRRRDASGINELYPPGPGQRAAEGT
ncbi:hypothetical protein AB0H76_29925 [Nocardia sp. NPDC050712]|uniref:hypothetical protein n=1 Tax=Nocardia sp. NPDC050712 TaxID=3155518 RepID=UPI0033ED54EB